jgi:hypothetical protein
LDTNFDARVNYGALPQTYEDPAHADAWTQVLGDGARGEGDGNGAAGSR